MTVDWNAKPTHQLKIMLQSLLRYQPNAKTEREKRNSHRSIDAITKILKSRGEL